MYNGTLNNNFGDFKRRRRSDTRKSTSPKRFPKMLVRLYAANTANISSYSVHFTYRLDLYKKKKKNGTWGVYIVGKINQLLHKLDADAIGGEGSRRDNRIKFVYSILIRKRNCLFMSKICRAAAPNNFLFDYCVYVNCGLVHVNGGGTLLSAVFFVCNNTF